MKVTLDIDQLLTDGRISQEEYGRLRQFSTEITASLALNIVLAFGISAAAGGVIALLQASSATITLGVFVAGLGGYICGRGISRLKLLGNILLPLGALTAAGGIIAATHGSVGGFASVAASFIAVGLIARGGLLVSLSVFAILSALGGATGYEHAAYFLCIKRPLLTVIVFALLGVFGYAISRYVSGSYSRLATIFSRTSAVVANFGFWIGSLWGDASSSSGASEWFFIIAWAAVILAAGVWAAGRGSRWLVNTAATFGAIHLYTQWFEHFDATPGSITLAGLFTIAIAYAFICYNQRAKKDEQPA